MGTVHKFSLIAGENKITMPVKAKILHVGNQDNAMLLWAEVDTSNLTVERTFYVLGTGKELPNVRLQYVGTILLYDGEYVVHVYERALI